MKPDKEKDCCFYCERKFIPQNYGTNKTCAKTIDHIIPIAKKGNNTLHNKINACAECNHWKANLSLDEFKEQVKIFIIKNENYKTISKELFYTIIKNIFELKKYVENNKDKLILKKTNNQNHWGKKLSLVGDHLRRMEEQKMESQLTKRMKESYGSDFNVTSTEKKEHDIFLMNQTPEQFMLAQKFGWKFAKSITEPEPNFHEKE